MSNARPVVIYGASGYTGRLVAEYCREYSLPFLALGRDQERVSSVIDVVPGITEVEHSVAAVGHDVDAIAGAIDGAKVVINTVGPFLDLGHPVVEACARVGAHYLDTNGEQPWMIEAADRHGAAFAEAGLALAPGVAQMYTGGEIAANVALETPGLDTLDILVLWKGAPTTASTETIFSTLMAPSFYLEDNAYVAWPDGITNEVQVPGQHELAMTTPWSGTAHPVWFKNDGRVQTVRAYGGVFDRGLMNVVKQITDTINEQVKPLETEEAQQAAIAEIKKQVAAPMPPRENQRYNRSIDSAWATGPLGAVHCVIHGACNYKQTALLCAHGAHQLVHGGPPRRTGFASACQLWGHRELLGVLQTFGLVGTPQVTGAAR